MATNLTEFLVRLSREPELYAAYKADPTGTMNTAGVSADDQEIMDSGDDNRITAALDPQHLGDGGHPFPDGIHSDGIHSDGIHSEDGIHSDGIHSDGIHSEDGIHSDGIHSEDDGIHGDE